MALPRSASPSTNYPPKNPFENRWGIYNVDDLQPAFDIDSVVDVDFSMRTKVSQFPVESGSFANYNKVQEPFSGKLRLSVGGDSTRMAVFLVDLDYAVKDVTLFNLMTPEQTYKNVTLVDYSYKRSASSGCNKIEAEVSVVEIREVSPQYATTKVTHPKKKAAVSKVETGKQQTTDASNDASKGASGYKAGPITQAYRDKGITPPAGLPTGL